MDLYYRIFSLFFLAQCCIAGPLVALVADLAETIITTAEVGGTEFAEATAEEVGNAIRGSIIGRACGFGLNGLWTEDYVLVNGELYLSTGLAAAGTLAAAGVGVVVGCK